MNSFNKKLKYNNKTLVKSAYWIYAWRAISFIARGAGSIAVKHPVKSTLATYVLMDEGRRDAAKKLISPITGEAAEGVKKEKMERFASLVLDKYEKEWVSVTKKYAESDEYLDKMIEYVHKESKGEDKSSIINEISSEFIRRIEDMRRDFFGGQKPENKSWYQQNDFDFNEKEEHRASEIIDEIKSKTEPCLDAGRFAAIMKRKISDKDHGKPIETIKGYDIDEEQTKANARAISVVQSTDEEIEAIFSEFEYDSEDESAKFDELINKRYPPKLSNKAPRMMNFLQDLEFKIHEKGKGAWSSYTNMTVFETAGQERRDGGRDGIQARLTSLMSALRLSQRNLGVSDDDRILILNYIKQNVRSKKVKEACEEIEVHIMKNESNDGYLRPNKLASNSKFIMKKIAAAGVTTDNVDRAKEVLEFLKTITATKKLSRTDFSEWGGTSYKNTRKVLGEHGAVINRWYSQNKDAADKMVKFFEANSGVFEGVTFSGNDITKFGSLVKYLCNTDDFSESTKAKVYACPTSTDADKKCQFRTSDGSTELKQTDTGYGNEGNYLVIETADANAEALIPILNGISTLLTSASYNITTLIANVSQPQGQTQNQPLVQPQIPIPSTVSADAKAILDAGLKVVKAGGNGFTNSNTSKVGRQNDGIASFNSAINNLKTSEDKTGKAKLTGNVYAVKFTGGVTGDYLVVGDQRLGGSSYYFVENTGEGGGTTYFLAGFIRFIETNTNANEAKAQIACVFGTNARNIQPTYNPNFTIDVGDGSTIKNYPAILIPTNLPQYYPVLDRALGVQSIRSYSGDSDLRKEPENMTSQGKWFLNVFKEFASNTSRVSVGIDKGFLEHYHPDKNLEKERAFYIGNQVVARPQDILKSKQSVSFNAFAVYKKRQKGLGFEAAEPLSIEAGIKKLRSEQMQYCSPYIVKYLHQGGTGDEVFGYFNLLTKLCFLEANSTSIFSKSGTYGQLKQGLESKLKRLKSLAFKWAKKA